MPEALRTEPLAPSRAALDALELRGYRPPGLARVVLLTLVPMLCLLAALLAVSRLEGIPVAHLTDDRNSTLGVPFYVGLLSQLGVLFWCAAAAICLFAAALLRERSGEAAAFLGGSGLLTAALALDDAFLLHESFAPEYLGIPDRAVYAAYAAAALAGLALHRRLVRRSAWPLLLLALALLGVSVAIDASPFRPSWRHFAEDGAKLVGLAFWLVYFARTALAEVRGALGAQPGARSRGGA